MRLHATAVTILVLFCLTACATYRPVPLPSPQIVFARGLSSDAQDAVSGTSQPTSTKRFDSAQPLSDMQAAHLALSNSP
ncbi:MAG: hypothetical protein ABJA62_06185, partial [Luteimonas sp.]